MDNKIMFLPLLPEYNRVITHCNALPFYLIEVSQKVGLVQELKIPSFISFVSTILQIPCLTSHEDKRVVTDPKVDHTRMRDFSAIS